MKLFNNPKASMMRLITIMILFVFCVQVCIFPSRADASLTEPIPNRQAEFYVSPEGNDANDGSEANPFKTINKAKEAVSLQNKNMSGDIVVYLRGGVYELSNTITFGADDSGSNGHKIIYRNYKDEIPVIEGGKKITGWTLDENTGLYYANAGDIEFRQLYVNNKKATRARIPNVGEWYNLVAWQIPLKPLVPPVPATATQAQWDEWSKGIDMSLKINKNAIASWERLNQVEMVVARSFVQNRFRIDKYETDAEYAYVTPMSPEKQNAVIKGAANPAPGPGSYYFENAYEFLDSAGEWYLNTVTDAVYYKPLLGEDMTNVVAVAPVVEKMLDITDAYDILFYGLNFQHAAWNEPNEKGLIQRQSGMHTHSEPNELLYSVNPAAIYLKGCSNIQFERNVFRQMGANAINFDKGTHDNLIVGNVFSEISDTAIDYAIENNRTASEADRNYNDTIKNNYFYKMGDEYWSGAAIWAFWPDSLKILNNEIDGSGNLGINIGWGANSEATCFKAVEIRNNQIHNCANLTNDSGGIHTKSNASGAIIAENWIYDIGLKPEGWLTGTDYPIAGVYLDDFSVNYTVEKNVFENINGVNVKDKTGKNTLIDNDSQAQAIKNNAGISTEYLDIKDYVNGGNIGGIDGDARITPSVEKYWSEFFMKKNWDENPVQSELPDWYLENRVQGHTRLPNQFLDMPKFSNTAEAFKKAGINVYTRHVKTGVEDPWWPSKYPLGSDGQPLFDGERQMLNGSGNPSCILSAGRNLVTEFLNEADSQGSKMIAYYWFMNDKTVTAMYPEWICKDVKGQNVAGKKQDYYPCINNPGYREIVKKRLLELADMGVEGFYFDEQHMPKEGCWCDYCKNKFKEITGYDAPKDMDLSNPLYRIYLYYRNSAVEEAFAYLSDELHTKNKNAVLLISTTVIPSLLNNTMTTNLSRIAGGPKNEYEIAIKPGMDYNFFGNNPDVAKIEDDIKIGLGWTILRDSADGRPPHIWRLGYKDEEHAVAATAGMLTYGCVANMDIAEDALAELLNGNLLNVKDRTPMNAIMRTAELGKTVSPYLAYTKPVKWAAVHYSEIARNKRGNDYPAAYGEVLWPAVGAFEVLSREGLPVGVVNDFQLEKGQLEGYKLLFLPNPDELSPAQKQEVNKFVAVGGIVIYNNPSLNWMDKNENPITKQQLLNTISPYIPTAPVKGNSPVSKVHTVAYVDNKNDRQVICISNDFGFAQSSLNPKPSALPPEAVKGYELFVRSKNCPEEVYEVISGQYLKTVPVSDGYKVQIPEFKNMAMVIVEKQVSLTAPTNLVAKDITTSSVNLEWNNSNEKTVSFEVYKNDGLLDTVVGDVYKYAVTGLNEGTTYEFKLKAKDSKGNVSDFSNILSVKTNSPTVIVTPPYIEAEKEPEVKNGEITLSPTLDKTTQVGVTVIDDKRAEKLLATSKSGTDGQKTICLDIGKLEGAKGYLQKIPLKLFNEKENLKIEIKTELGNVEIHSELVQKLSNILKNNLSVSISKIDGLAISGDAKLLVNDRPALDIKLLDGDKLINQFGTIKGLELNFEYSAKEDEKKDYEHLVIVKINEDGKFEVVPSGKYNIQAGNIEVQLKDNGKYAVAFVKKTFEDIVGYDWAKKEIEVMASKGIINGTSEKTFMPDEQIKRADLVVLLVKALGLMGEAEDSFKDVKSTDYYYNEIAIAKQHGLANGDGQYFNPEEYITRQDLMVLVDRALRLSGKIEGINNPNYLSFADWDKVNDYAANSVAAMISERIVRGDGANINPLGKATRAEAAVIVYRMYNK